MTPAARVQAAIELLDRIIAAARDDGAAADTLIARYFKDRRYAGSKDRRAVRELVYRAIRRHGERPESGRAAMLGLAGEDEALAALFDGSPHGPAPIQPDEPGVPPSLLPGWIAPELAALVDGAEQTELLSRAPLHLRVNALKAARDDLLGHWPDARPLAHLSHGIALPAGTDVERDPLLQTGQIEVQDGGSQLIALACAARSGMTVLDLCAGGGGKTLALAADMLMPRARRAGAEAMIETLLLDPGREAERLAPLAGQCDVVLVDAPCSGAGTWRRNPEARWRLTPARLDRVAALQAHLLTVAAPLVKPGGRLVYAVCSLLDREGRGQIQQFESLHPAWQARRETAMGRPWGAGTLLTPYHDGTDGFFFAALEKPC